MKNICPYVASDTDRITCTCILSCKTTVEYLGPQNDINNDNFIFQEEKKQS